jgi:hypothetical protein
MISWEELYQASWIICFGVIITCGSILGRTIIMLVIT